MTDPRSPVRLGFQTHLHGDLPARELYPRMIDLFVAAEELGFDSGWVAQHHLSRNEGRLPSPLPFLAAVAGRTSRIRLGTSVVTLTLEDPLRVAEDAAVVDALSDGRLELGLGSGNPHPDQFAAFRRDVSSRHAIYEDGFARLRSALRGEALEGGLRLEPPAPTLADRLWESPLSEARVAAAGARGSGVLIGIGPAATVQRSVARAYVAAAGSGLGGEGAGPRVAVVHSAFFGDSASAVADGLWPGLQKNSRDYYVRAGWVAPDSGPAELLEAMNIHHGTVEDVARSIGAVEVLDDASDLILAVQSHTTGIDRAFRALETIARTVKPVLAERAARTGSSAPVPARVHAGDR